MIRAARRAGHAAVSAAAGLGAAGVLVALTAGTPWLMWHVTGWPLPRHLPTLATLRAGIAGQESARFILALVTCAGWVIWLVFVTEVILEAAWWARQLPGLARGQAGRPGAAWLRERAAAVSPPRAVATILVGGILLGLLAALRGTGAALTVPAMPRLAAVARQAVAAAPPHPAREDDRSAALQARTPAPAGNVAAAPQEPPAGDTVGAARAGGRMIRLDAVLRPDVDQPGSPAYTLYTVQPGDNLWDIALTHLGNGEDWHQIYALNAGRLQPDGERLVLPSLIQPGWILGLPAPATASAPSGNGHLTSPPAPVTPTAGPAPGRAPSPLPQPPVHRLSPAPVPHHTQPDAGSAVSIPWGGLIGAGLAGAVTGALVLAGIQRRRRYQPARIMTPSLEPGAPPVPPLIGVLRRAARPSLLSEPADGTAGSAPGDSQADPRPSDNGGTTTVPLARAHTAAALPPGVISLGLRDGHEVTADIAALGGLGLTGPGAFAAARAVLLTALSQAQPGVGSALAAVFVPAADAGMLVPGRKPASQPGLTVTSTLHACLDQLETAVLARARTAGDGDRDPGDAPSVPAAAAVGTAALIATPDPASSPRIAAILRMGRSAGVAGVLLGDWPDGVTCHVAADATITRTVPPHPVLDGLRLFHLSAPDAAAILSALRQAHASEDNEQNAAPAPKAARPASGVQSQDSTTGTDGRQAQARQAAHPATPVASTAPQPADDIPAASTPPVDGTPPAAGSDDPQARPRTPPPPGGPAVQVVLLGPPRITAAGREITGGLRKGRELLAFLALHPDGATGEQVAEALWPEAPPGHGSSQRNMTVRKLRDLLRTATGLTAARFITLTADRYQLDPALLDIDIWRFQSALDQARRAGSEDAELAACRAAAAVYQGPLADGAGYDWAEPYAEQARRRALDAWTRIAEITAPRDPGQALTALEAALGHDPYNEFVYQKIMRLQAAAGRPDAVRRTLGLLEARLGELGITPGPQTRALAASLLGARTPPPPPAAVKPAAAADDGSGRPALRLDRGSGRS